MAYRWKVPEFNAGFVDPQGVQSYQLSAAMQNSAAAANAAQQMRGYHPTWTDLDVINAGAEAGGDRGGYNQVAEYEQQQKQQEIQGKIYELQTELAQIDSQIAEIEKTMPKGVSDAEWEIAAKRAEIGDNSAYDNLVSRGYNQMATARSVEDNIKNELYNAEKLTWGLNVKSDEEQEMAANQIDVSLRKAEDMAAKNGTELPEGYYRLKTALKNYRDKKAKSSDDGVKNSRVYENELYTKAKNKTLRDADIKAAEKYLEDNPGSEDASRIKTFVGKYANQTVEAREREKVNKQKADEIYQKLSSASSDGAKKIWTELSKKEERIFKTYYNVSTDASGKLSFTRK